LIASDGLLTARIFTGTKRAVYFRQVKDAGIDGFELNGDWNEGSAGGGLMRIYEAEGIVARGF
jgi:hypothetical protein